MKHRPTRLFAGFAGLVLVTLCVLRYGVLVYFDRNMNAVLVPGPYAVSAEIRAFHQGTFVADMHADSLLWRRNLQQRTDRGQADLPRLLDGGVDLQVFSVVTQVPYALNLISNNSDSDKLPILFLASWRSPATWFSPKARALAQASELAQLAQASSLSLVLRKKDLGSAGIKALLALEGMHALGGQASALDELYAAGFRMMGLAHFFDNEIAGSAQGVDKYGLTELGRSLIPRMEALGITIDLAHASAAAFSDTLAIAGKPVVVSHGGVAGTCPGPRNLSDAQLRSIADNGGVVGIGYWKAAVCDTSLAGITAAIRYVISVAGVDHVGLGSDFDGTVVTPFDASGLPMLTETLLDAGLSEADVAKVLGGNARRVLAANLPQ